MNIPENMKEITDLASQLVNPCKFENGKIVATNNGLFIGIIKVKNNIQVGAYCSIDYSKDFRINSDYRFDRIATEEEKAKLFQAIKDNGYKWNEETKTLEKLMEPKFKVGDRIRYKADPNFVFTITSITKDKYECGKTFVLRFTNQDDYELVPNKFDITTLKPFESRVLVRNANNKVWRPTIFGCYTKDKYEPFYVLGGTGWKQCIPYEDNQHLLGKTDDCDEIYKNW